MQPEIESNECSSSKTIRVVYYSISTRVLATALLVRKKSDISSNCAFFRDLRIVFFVRIESRIESAVYTTQAVTRPDGPQAYRTGL